jgi:hypothetical protein
VPWPSLKIQEPLEKRRLEQKGKGRENKVDRYPGITRRKGS